MSTSPDYRRMPQRVGCDILVPQEPESHGFCRAMLLCIAFDLLLAALFLAWRALPWLH